MLKWWRLPLYPDWINAENTIIWLVTFRIQIQIQIFKFSNSKQTFVFAGFCCKTYFLNLSAFFFLCFILVDAFSGSIKTEKSQKILLPQQKVISGEKKTFVHSLELWRNFICGNETGSPGRAVSLHLARSGSQWEHRIRCILPARGACHIIRVNIAFFSFLLCALCFFGNCVGRNQVAMGLAPIDFENKSSESALSIYPVATC